MQISPYVTWQGPEDEAPRLDRNGDSPTPDLLIDALEEIEMFTATASGLDPDMTAQVHLLAGCGRACHDRHAWYSTPRAYEVIDHLGDVIARQRDDLAALRGLLVEAAGMLADESDALRSGSSIIGDDRLSDDPEDAPTVDAIREIEDWIARAAHACEK